MGLQAVQSLIQNSLAQALPMSPVEFGFLLNLS